MIPSVRRRRVALVVLLGLFMGCTVPSSASPPLTAAAAQNLLDGWNPNYCKVAEFYGFYTPKEGANSRVAYVLIVNPSDKNVKPAVYEGCFQLLTAAGGAERWFLVSLLTHSSGLSRKQGWDNLMIPVKETTPAPSR